MVYSTLSRANAITTLSLALLLVTEDTFLAEAVGGVKNAATGLPSFAPEKLRTGAVSFVTASSASSGVGTASSQVNSDSATTTTTADLFLGHFQGPVPSVNYSCCEQPDSWGPCASPVPLTTVRFNETVGLHEYVIRGRAGQSFVADLFVSAHSLSSSTTFKALVVNYTQYHEYEGDQPFLYYEELSSPVDEWATCSFAYGTITDDEWAAKVLLIWNDPTGNPQYEIAIGNGAAATATNSLGWTLSIAFIIFSLTTLW